MKADNTRYFINGWLIDQTSGSIIHKETKQVKRLGEYQLKLLETLALHAGTVLSRERLTGLVWEKRIIGNNSLPNAIHALRAALEDDGKVQKIIKTIPKKGYLLEQDYCEHLVPEEPTVEDEIKLSQMDNAVVAQQHKIPGYKDWQIMPQAENSTEEKTSMLKRLPPLGNSTYRNIHFSRGYPFYILIGLFIVAAFIIGVFFFNPSSSQLDLSTMDVKKVASKSYNHINLFQVFRTSTPGQQSAYNVPERLKSALERVNTLLDNHNATMDIYYRASDAILHYTFSLKTECEHKELSMNIFHWRINKERLNDLIYREAERKINELSTCHS